MAKAPPLTDQGIRFTHIASALKEAIAVAYRRGDLAIGCS
jgi:hypothetical protein